MKHICLLFVGLLSLTCVACSSSDPAPPPPRHVPTAVVSVPQPHARVVIPLLPARLKAGEQPSAVLPSASALTPTALPTATAMATLASDLSTPAPVRASDNPAAAEAELVRLVNQTRAERGLPPYEVSDELSAAARLHSCDLASHARISHVSSDGLNLTQRLHGSQTAWQWPSENIAAGSDDPAVILGMWMDEPPDGPHLLNILSADQQAIGVGYCFRADDPSGNQHYWTADFARH